MGGRQGPFIKELNVLRACPVRTQGTGQYKCLNINTGNELSDEMISTVVAWTRRELKYASLNVYQFYSDLRAKLPIRTSRLSKSVVHPSFLLSWLQPETSDYPDFHLQNNQSLLILLCA